jgi:GNAT superfamily N-acetyltransferase
VVTAEHRGHGIGRHLVAAVEALAARRGCEVVGATAAGSGAAAALLGSAGFRMLPAPSEAAEPRRWEHHLTAAGAEAGG